MNERIGSKYRSENIQRRMIAKNNEIDEAGEYCEVCNTFVEGFEYQMCCSGKDCGCLGMPVEPCVCSNECWDKLINT